MTAWEKSRDLERVAMPHWIAQFHRHFGSDLNWIESKHDDKEFQASKMGDYKMSLDQMLNTIETKTQSPKYLAMQTPDFTRILFEKNGNATLNRPGSAFFDSRADYYAFAYYNGKGLEYVTIMYTPQTQAWLAKRLKENPGVYPVIKTLPESNDGIYETEFWLVPLRHIPHRCISWPHGYAVKPDVSYFWNDRP